MLIYIIFFVDGPELSGFEEIDFVLERVGVFQGGTRGNSKPG